VKRYVFHPDANEEYAEALAYYMAIDYALGDRFFNEIETLISDICRYPERYRLLEPPVRRHFSQVFPYAVLYLNQPDRIYVAAVMDMRRDPHYWRSRLK
jgi:plasmid stabilization system protein ParE